MEILVGPQKQLAGVTAELRAEQKAEKVARKQLAAFLAQRPAGLDSLSDIDRYIELDVEIRRAAAQAERLSDIKAELREAIEEIADMPLPGGVVSLGADDDIYEYKQAGGLHRTAIVPLS